MEVTLCPPLGVGHWEIVKENRLSYTIVQGGGYTCLYPKNQILSIRKEAPMPEATKWIEASSADTLPIHKWETPGESVSGTLVSKGLVRVVDVEKTRLEIHNEDSGPHVICCSPYLQRIVEEAERSGLLKGGGQCRITYEGDRPPARKGMHPMRLFKLEVAQL